MEHLKSELDEFSIRVFDDIVYGDLTTVAKRIKKFPSHSFNPNAIGRSHRATLLHHAIDMHSMGHCSFKAFDVLLALGADPSIKIEQRGNGCDGFFKDCNGLDAIEHARKVIGSGRIVRLLSGVEKPEIFPGLSDIQATRPKARFVPK